MQHERAERAPLEHTLEHDFPTGHAVVLHREMALRLERVESSVLLAWLSDATVIDFLRRLDLGHGVLALSVTRTSPGAPVVSSERLQDPESLTNEDIASIHLVRVDLPDSVIVWEKAGDERSDIAVLTTSWERAQQYLGHFIPLSEFPAVASAVEEFRLAS